MKCRVLGCNEPAIKGIDECKNCHWGTPHNVWVSEYEAFYSWMMLLPLEEYLDLIDGIINEGEEIIHNALFGYWNEEVRK